MKVTNFADKKIGLKGSQEDIVMGIDADNHLTLLNSLTHLYANPVMAAFREYCANASDAHKDSGQTKPFEVSFPHRHEGQPNLRIRDYGNGMTEEQITKIYSQYGATTKANNNAQVGGFGLGSKSGLAVSNHLYVNTIANGILVKAQILKNKDNKSVIRILSKEPTKEPSGTEIILPVKLPQLKELREKAEEELVGYKPSQVKLNGNQIAYSVHDKKQFLPVSVGSNVIAYIALNDGLQQNLYSLSDYSQELIKTNLSVIMGGVYYPSMPSMGSMDTTDNEFLQVLMDLNKRFQNSPKVILNVPVGSVDLPPHRDSIIDTEKTWASLKALLLNLRMGLTVANESFLNEMSMKDASRTVASMRELFAPQGEWKHKGKTYNNNMAVAMSNAPFLYTHVARYGAGQTKLEGLMNVKHFTALHTRNASGDYNYQYGTKKKIAVFHLPVPQDKYDEIVAYEANLVAHQSVRVKMNKPRIGSYITRYLKAVIFKTLDTEDFYVVITPEGTPIPVHFAGAIDATGTEESVRAEYRKLFPSGPKKVVEQKHCRVTKDKLEYSLVSSQERIVYCGGKDAYGAEDFMMSQNREFSLPETVIMRKVSRGSVRDTDKYNWVQAGLLNLVPAGSALIAVGDTRAPKSFKKTFKDAVPLGELVMDYYENLDETRKLAVQHAYSLIALWGEGTDVLFSIMGGKDYPMRNESIRLMFKEPELVSVAHYLFAFKDNYVEGLLEWKKNTFIPSLKNKKLAGMMLLPLQSLLGQFYAIRHNPADGMFKTRLPLRCDNTVHGDDVAEFANKLTAY
jgi:hypothetical protein